MSTKVIQLLKALELDQYVDIFQQNEMTFEALLACDKSEFRELVPALGPRKTLMDAVAEMKRRGNQLERSNLKGPGKGGHNSGDSYRDHHQYDEEFAPPETRRITRGQGEPSRWVMVTNLHPKATYKHVLDFMSTISHRIVRISGQCTAGTWNGGSVLIEFDDKRLGQCAVQNHGSYLMGRPISVQYADPETVASSEYETLHCNPFHHVYGALDPKVRSKLDSLFADGILKKSDLSSQNVMTKLLEAHPADAVDALEEYKARADGKIFPGRVSFLINLLRIKSYGMSQSPDNYTRHGYEYQDGDSESSHSHSSRKRHLIKVSGLPYCATPADIREFFEGLAIAKDGVVFEKDPTHHDRPTGIAYVTFATEAAAAKAMKRDGDWVGNRYVKLKKVGHAGFHSNNFSINWEHSTRGTTVYVGNMPRDVTEEELCEMFGPLADKLVGVTFASDRKTSRFKGYAFVVFEDEESAIEALAYDGTTIHGFKVVVRPRDREPPPDVRITPKPACFHRPMESFSARTRNDEPSHIETMMLKGFTADTHEFSQGGQEGYGVSALRLGQVTSPLPSTAAGKVPEFPTAHIDSQSSSALASTSGTASASSSSPAAPTGAPLAPLIIPCVRNGCESDAAGKEWLLRFQQGWSDPAEETEADQLGLETYLKRMGTSWQ